MRPRCVVPATREPDRRALDPDGLRLVRRNLRRLVGLSPPRPARPLRSRLSQRQARTRVDRVAVAVGYAAALVPAAGRSEIATIVLAALFVGAAVWGYLRAVGKERRARVAVVQAAAALAVVLAAGALARLAFPTGDANEAVLLGYELTLIAVAVGLLVRALASAVGAGGREGSRGRARQTCLRARCETRSHERSATRRCGLATGFPRPRSYVDAAGDRVELPEPGASRAVTLRRAGPAAARRAHPRPGCAR